MLIEPSITQIKTNENIKHVYVPIKTNFEYILANEPEPPLPRRMGLMRGGPPRVIGQNVSNIGLVQHSVREGRAENIATSNVFEHR